MSAELVQCFPSTRIGAQDREEHAYKPPRNTREAPV